MFRGRNSKQNSRRRNAQIDTLIGSGTVLRGDIHFKDGLHIDGVVKGNVIAEGENSMLTMSENGRIEGEVRVHNIVLNGEVKGDVHALEHVELAAQARVTGNVYYALIEMAMGAEVNGNLVHRSEVAEPEAETDSEEPAADKA
ncbi:MAG TPA: polymer-forming cytoskeletal family protein [Gammaproteobacteria bacterium]|nr:polymer-forming cytoskeletal family protein [Gammaproteobacteria bacterium]